MELKEFIFDNDGITIGYTNGSEPGPGPTPVPTKGCPYVYTIGDKVFLEHLDFSEDLPSITTFYSDVDFIRSKAEELGAESCITFIPTTMKYNDIGNNLINPAIGYDIEPAGIINNYPGRYGVYEIRKDLGVENVNRIFYSNTGYNFDNRFADALRQMSTTSLVSIVSPSGYEYTYLDMSFSFDYANCEYIQDLRSSNRAIEMETYCMAFNFGTYLLYDMIKPDEVTSVAWKDSSEIEDSFKEFVGDIIDMNFDEWYSAMTDNLPISYFSDIGSGMFSYDCYNTHLTFNIPKCKVFKVNYGSNVAELTVSMGSEMKEYWPRGEVRGTINYYINRTGMSSTSDISFLSSSAFSASWFNFYVPEEVVSIYEDMIGSEGSVFAYDFSNDTVIE